MLLVRSSFPPPQGGRLFNEDLPNWGYPPRPWYKFTRRLGAPSWNVIVAQLDGAKTSDNRDDPLIVRP